MEAKSYLVAVLSVVIVLIIVNLASIYGIIDFTPLFAPQQQDSEKPASTPSVPETSQPSDIPDFDMIVPAEPPEKEQLPEDEIPKEIPVTGHVSGSRSGGYSSTSSESSSAPSCSNECLPSGVSVCEGDTKMTCGNYDSDSCLEWGDEQQCAYGCYQGECMSINFTNFTIFVNPLVMRSEQGQYFLIDVDINTTVEVYALQASLGFDPGMLNATSAYDREFLKITSGASTYTILDINHTSGEIYFASTILVSPNGTSGEGTLFSVNFTALSYGNSSLALSGVIAANSSMQPPGIQPIATANGTVMAG